MKVLKVENVELSSKVDAADAEVKNLQTETIKLREHLDEVKEELRETTLNLKATEAVVSEQVALLYLVYQNYTRCSQ